MKRIATTAVVLAGLGLAFVLSCDRAAPEETEAPLVLRAYSVPAGMEGVVTVTLNQAMDLGEDRRVGRAQTAPDGTLLVAAPESYHPGIAEFLRQLADGRTGSESAPTLHFDLWVVLGKKSADRPSLEGYGDLRPALEAIVESQGSQEFLVVETLSGSLISGEEAHLQGALTNLNIRASDLGDTLETLVIIQQDFGTQLRTTIRALEGELVVLGQAGAPVRRDDDRLAPWAYGDVFETKGRYPRVERQPVVYHVLRATRAH